MMKPAHTLTASPKKWRIRASIAACLLALAPLSVAQITPPSPAQQQTPRYDESRVHYAIALAQLFDQEGQHLRAYQTLFPVARFLRSASMARQATMYAASAEDGQAVLQSATLWEQLSPNEDNAWQTADKVWVLQENYGALLARLNKRVADDANAINEKTVGHYLGLARRAKNPALMYQTYFVALGAQTKPAAQLLLLNTAVAAKQADAAMNAFSKVLQNGTAAERLQAAAMMLGSADAAQAEQAISRWQASVAQPSADEYQLWARAMFEYKNPAGAQALLLKGLDGAKTLGQQLPFLQLFIGQRHTDRFTLLRDAPQKLGAQVLAKTSIAEWLQYADVLESFSHLREVRTVYGNVLAAPADTSAQRDLITWAQFKNALNNVKLSNDRAAQALQLEQAVSLRTQLPAERFDAALHALSAAYARAGQADKAVAMTRQVHLADPSNTRWLFEYASALAAAEQIAAMDQLLSPYITKNPKDAEAANLLGYTLADKGQQLPRARQLLEAAYAQDKSSIPVQDSIAWVKYRQGELQAAKTILEDAAAAWPDPEVVAHLAQVLWALGDKAQAQTTLDAARRLDAFHPAVKQAEQAMR